MKLITNGDDFGITRSANFGIIDCYKDGILKSCSMMVNMPSAEHAAQLMKEYPDFSVGIHLNLTVGKPLLKTHKTLLKEDGTFNKGMLKDSEYVDVEEIRAELYAQVEKYIALTGKVPDHLNSHHGIEMIKGAEAIVCELSKKYDLPVRRFFTLPKGDHPDVDYKIPLMKFGGGSLSELSTPKSLTELYTKEEIDSEDIFEFALHPGYVDYEIFQISSLTVGRAHDAHVFLSEEAKQWVEDNHIELIDYRDIPKK